MIVWKKLLNQHLGKFSTLFLRLCIIFMLCRFLFYFFVVWEFHMRVHCACENLPIQPISTAFSFLKESPSTSAFQIQEHHSWVSLFLTHWVHMIEPSAGMLAFCTFLKKTLHLLTDISCQNKTEQNPTSQPIKQTNKKVSLWQQLWIPILPLISTESWLTSPCSSLVCTVMDTVKKNEIFR